MSWTAAIAAFGSEIDDAVRFGDDVEVVLDDDDRRPGVHELVEHPHELLDIAEMKPGRGQSNGSYLHLQLSSHSNYSAREVYFDDIQAGECSGG